MTDTQWDIGTPEAAGLVSDVVRRLDAGRESGLLHDIHTVAVARDGRLAFERYYESHDETIPRDLGTVRFAADTLHDLRSVTKSIVSLLYGIALGRGLVPPVETPAVEGFPEYPDLAADPARRKVTIAHALTMTMGFEWDESKPYTSTENSEIAMEFAADRYRFVLDRPIVAEPGEKWIYSGGAVALIGALIERGTGKRLGDFARETLFEPLGISNFEWWVGEDGVTSAAAGLRLSTRDLLRIGQVMLDGGRFDGRQVIPEAWLQKCLAHSIDTSFGAGYGYLWYLGKSPVGEGVTQWVAGFGNGGQRFWVAPELRMVCVTYAGDYNAPDSWVGPERVWREIVLGNLTTQAAAGGHAGSMRPA